MPILAIFAAIAVAAYVLGECRNSATLFGPPHDEAVPAPWAPRHGHSRPLGDLPWALPVCGGTSGPPPAPRAPGHPVVTLGLLDDLPPPTSIPGPGARGSR